MIQLRPYQDNAFSALIEYFHTSPTGHPILSLPCGAGKSIIIGKICEYALQFENQKIIVASHIKELLIQDAAKFHALCPDISYGLYCAGLGKKQLGNKVTFASVQSAYKDAIKFGFINLFILDEAHLLSNDEDSMYHKFIDALLAINPKMRIIGLTASPWRTRTGLLTQGDGALFTDIAYEIPLQRLVKEGWLCKMIGKQAKTQGDTSNISIRAGEFVMKEAEDIFDEENLVQSAVNELLTYGEERRTWLIFCTSIKHAEHVAKALNEVGISCKAVSEKTSPSDRAEAIESLKNGTLRAITNVTVLTTGTDIPNIDLICMLRPTESPGLFMQMAGRGFRLAQDKEDCLLLDMAGNLLKHGPLTHIEPPSASGGIISRENKGKICPQCEEVISAHRMVCEGCGYEFPPQPRTIKHSEKAHYAAAMDLDSEVPDITKGIWYTVSHIDYGKHVKADSPHATLKVTYYCSDGLKTKTFSQWICFEHSGYARDKAVKWWEMHEGTGYPIQIDDVIYKIHNGYIFKIPDQIFVQQTSKYPEIKRYKMKERPANVADDTAGKGNNLMGIGKTYGHDNQYAARAELSELSALEIEQW